LRIVLVLLLLISFLAPNLGAEEVDYYLTGSINNGPPLQAETLFLKKGDRLSLAMAWDRPKTEPGIDRHSGTICWYRIKPVLKAYSNLWLDQSPERKKVHLAPIEYQKLLIEPATNQTTLQVNEIMAAEGCGAYYFAAEPSRNHELPGEGGAYFFAAGPIHKQSQGRIVQVVVRLDDTYLGYLSELTNTPFILAPMISPGGFHQTDHRVGSDCAALAIYGKRRQGFDIPYVGPRGIFRYLSPLTPAELQPVGYKSTEVYMDAQGHTVKIGDHGLKPGDIIHFGEQVAVFYQDSGILGLLDKDDYLFESYGTSPHVTTLAQSGFYHKAIRIFRWAVSLDRTPGATGNVLTSVCP
jgi:hypothetical protein